MSIKIGQVSVGDQFDGFLLVKSVNKGVTSGGKDFLTLFLADDSGLIEAKLWGSTKEDEEIFVPEQIIKVAGEITQFRGKSQLKIKSVRLAEVTDGVHISDFIARAPMEKDVLSEKLTEAMFEIKHAPIQRIVRAFVSKYEEDLLLYPAASRNHHEYASGLAYHIVSMLALAKDICKLYPEVNRDLLYAGIILHDIGKIKELSGVVSTSYTVEGKLLGHIPIMVAEVKTVADELQIEGEEVLILQHLILSHHGKKEWGSPTLPLVREAEILHLIDLIDAKMNMLNRSLETVKPGEFTERLFAMDNRAFYKPTFETE